ncbi:MAG: cytochrome c4 [Sulfuricella sp.]|nr:cytochrome c4 [Sulfuricella sp.]
MKHLNIATLIVAGLATGSVQAAPPKGDAEKGKQIVGQICIACHGIDGNGTEPTNPEFPKLAGKQGEYLLKQLKEFKNGKRKSDIMGGIVAGLSDGDITNLAVYFAGQKNKPNAPKAPELVESGKKFYTEGSPDNGVPACYGCHLQDASGTDKYPHLAGQHSAYTYQQLKRFAAGERENDKGLVMQSLAMRMSEQEMKAVSEYIMSMK